MNNTQWKFLLYAKIKKMVSYSIRCLPDCHSESFVAKKTYRPVFLSRFG